MCVYITGKEHHREGEEEEEMVVKPYRFKMSEIEGFRYRVQVYYVIIYFI